MDRSGLQGFDRVLGYYGARPDQLDPAQLGGIDPEEYAALLAEIEGMSDEEARAFIAYFKWADANLRPPRSEHPKP